ncbi:hypothetical protein AB0I98_35455 [Streptomyces sp. NPDC050211]|uniref:hypothetical protein n=1 Tax=Streptomyces sp. NPDC050211 TaxID=3154932 RepID=UPI0034386D73
MRAEAQGWTIVHSKRTEWRGEFGGVFLGEHDGEWVAGRMYVGKSMTDGFGPGGEWWYATYYDLPTEHECYRARRAVREYVRLAKETAQCWDGIFEQRAGEAIDRHWARRAPLDNVADMSAGWVHPGLTGDIHGHTFLLPAVDAKYELLQYMRRSYAVSEAFRQPENGKTGSDLHQAFQAAVEAVGPVNLSVAGDRFSLSYQGRYNDADERWRRIPRNPHPDRSTGSLTSRPPEGIDPGRPTPTETPRGCCGLGTENARTSPAACGDSRRMRSDRNRE